MALMVNKKEGVYLVQPHKRYKEENEKMMCCPLLSSKGFVK